MRDYAATLTVTPPRASRDAVDGLRAQGWSDAAILDMVQVVGYFAFANRLADGLGVELEDHWSRERSDRAPDGRPLPPAEPGSG